MGLLRPGTGATSRCCCCCCPDEWYAITAWDHTWDADDPATETYEGTGVDFPDLGTRFALVPDRGIDVDAPKDLRRDDGTIGAALGLPGPVPGPLVTSGPWFGGRTLALADDVKNATGGASLFTSPDFGTTDPFTDDVKPIWGAMIVVPDDSGAIDAWWSPAIFGGTGVVTVGKSAGGFWQIGLAAGDVAVTSIPYVNNEPVLLIWHVMLGAALSFLEVNGVREYVTLVTNAPVISNQWGFFGRGYYAAAGMREGHPTDQEIARLNCYFDGLTEGAACGFYDDFETYADGTNPPFPPYVAGAFSPNEYVVSAGKLVPPSYAPGFDDSAAVAFGALPEDCQTIHIVGTIGTLAGSYSTAAIQLTTSAGSILCAGGVGSAAALIVVVDDGGGPITYTTPIVAPVGTTYEMWLSYCETTGNIVAHLLWGTAEDVWMTVIPTPCGTAQGYEVYQPYASDEGTASLDSFEITCEETVEPGTFLDLLARADGPVGNGWTNAYDLEPTLWDDIEISGNTLACPTPTGGTPGVDPAGRAAIFRDFGDAYSGGVHVRCIWNPTDPNDVGGPMVHVVPNAPMFGLGFYYEPGLDCFLLWAIGREPSDVSPVAVSALGLILTGPMVLEIISDGTTVNCYQDGNLRITAAVPAELVGSTVHGIEIDVEDTSAHLPVVLPPLLWTPL